MPLKDPQVRLQEVRDVAGQVLPRVRRQFFFRYILVWQKRLPAAAKPLQRHLPLIDSALVGDSTVAHPPQLEIPQRSEARHRAENPQLNGGYGTTLVKTSSVFP
jgi:hypothetical protein